MKYFKLTFGLTLISVFYFQSLAQSGNVGIGTSSPTEKLHIEEGNLKILNTSRPWLILDHSEDSIHGGVSWSYDGTPEMEVYYDPTYQDLRFVDPHVGLPRVVIRRTGAVGIGTSLPSHRLDVETFTNYDGFAAINGTQMFFGLPIKTFGVKGEIWNSLGTESAGVFGIHNSTTGSNAGVLGKSTSPVGVGIQGLVTDLVGVNHAVYGSTASSNGYAGYFLGGRNYFQGNVGIGTDSSNSMLHLFSEADGSRGIAVDANGILPSQQAYLELITKGGGTSKLGQPDNKGWHITGRGASYAGVSQRNDLLIANWNGSDWYNAMYFDTTGNIGIGNTNPTSALEIQGELELGFGTYSTIKTRDDVSQIQLQSSLTPYKGAYFLMNSADRPDDAGSVYITHGDFTAPAPSSLIRFRYANDGAISNQLVITAEGNVGIGTSSPQSLLHIKKSTGAGDPTNAHVDALIQDSYAYLEFSADTFGGITFKDDGASVHSGILYNYLSDKLQFRAGNINYLELDESGLLSLIASSKLGIGTVPNWPLHVTSNSELRTGYFYNEFSSSQPTYGIYAGAFGEGSGSKRGGSFDANGGTGENIGIRAAAFDGTSNIAVYGTASGGTTNWAGYFEDGNVFVNDRLGIGTSAPQHLVHATTSSLDRAGYYFNEKNSSSTKYGIYAGSYGTGSGANRGGVFEANNGTGTNTGVRGLAFNGSTNIGVYGNASGGTTNWAGYFENGNIYVQNNLGIGTSSPSRKLHISGGDIEINDSNPWIYLDNTISGNSGIYFQNANSTKSQVYYNGSQEYLHIGPQSGGVYMVVENGVGVGINTSSPSYPLHVVGSSVSDIAEFYNSSTNTGADVIRTKINNATPASLQYYIRCVDGNGGTDGGVRADGSGSVQFYSASDRRLKTNIRKFSGALVMLDKIQPRQYEMRQALGLTKYGFIAQELSKIYPSAVAGEENSDPEIEPMMIDYSKLTPLLAAATKELHQKVKDQQEEIDELKKQLVEIKKLLDAGLQTKAD